MRNLTHPAPAVGGRPFPLRDASTAPADQVLIHLSQKGRRLPTRKQPRNGRPIEVVLLDSGTASIVEWVKRTTAIDGMEYAGWLLGGNATNSVLVAMATGLAPHDTRATDSAVMDRSHAEELARQSGYTVLGRWHTHLSAGRNRPSSVDMRSAVQLFHHFGESLFIDLIVTPAHSEGWRSGWGRPDCRAFAYERGESVAVHPAVLVNWHDDADERAAARAHRAQPIYPTTIHGDAREAYAEMAMR